MSLKVWLPLNGNLNNQGASSITITNSNATIDNNGKIGKCYSFNGSNSYILGTHNFINNNTTEQSYSCWMKINSTQAGCLFSVRTATNTTGLTIFYYGSQQFVDDGDRQTFTPKTAITTGKQYHVCFTVSKTGGRKFFLDGSLDSSVASANTPTTVCTTHFMIGASQSSATSPSGNFLNGFLNDCRFYDHALSVKEVKEISKGLVGHYPLDNNSGGCPNLLLNSRILSNWAKETGITCTYDSEEGMYKVLDSSHTTSRWGIYQDLTINPNTTYTITCTLKGTSCSVGFGFFDSTVAWPPEIYVHSGEKKTISYTATSGANSTKCRVYLAVKCETSNIAWFNLPKVEVGSKSTPWSPNSSESDYSNFGYNSLSCIDNSGYGYHGTKTKLMNISSNTAKYSSSTAFDGNNDCILIPFNSMIKDTNYTISVWCYKSELGTDNYQTIFGGPSGFELEARNGTTNEAKFVTWNWGKVAYAYNFNEWYHVCFVHTSSDSKLYVNGNLIGTGTSASIPSGNYYIGSWRDTTSQNYQGNMSDFRIYATSLSADDVKELYQNSASVANNGTVMCYEFNEE